MKRILTILFCIITLPGIFTLTNARAADYVLIGWNDLGMHCANKDFSSFAVLPPYNNINAQLIRRGDANSLPEIVTEGFRVTYEIPGNTYSVGKTNFWQFVEKLFGLKLNDNIGLKGAGLSGEMLKADNHFYIEGIPVTPYTDANLNKEDPYQLALLKAYDSQGSLLATTRPVIPVSNEISCVSSGCHSSEQNILDIHPHEGGFNKNNKPVLCASCHASNALGTTGSEEAGPLSKVIHEEHAEKTNDCYKCHPGTKTKCFRDIMYLNMKKCPDCHGDMANIANTIENGRRPWLDEPSCARTSCHASKFSEESGKLFRQSKGHAALYCSACHGSPHAVVPTNNDRDNVQNIDLQGYSGPLSKCSVCHGVTPAGNGPHGFLAQEVGVRPDQTPELTWLFQNYPNPFMTQTNIPFRLGKAAKVRVEIIDERGVIVLIPVNEYLPAGEYNIPLNFVKLNSGAYYYRLNAGETVLTMKMNVVK